MLQSVYFEVEKLPDLENQIAAIRSAFGERKKIALYGEMGVGKTTFVNAFCRFLHTSETTASPTFSLINEYSYLDENGHPALVHHVDLYRLRNFQEALDIGIEDLLYDPWYCFIEWPQIIEPYLPIEDTAFVHIEIAGENRRVFQISWQD